MPTENRSSNTEMVSVKRELVEQAMQACFEAGFGIPHDALRDVLAQPAHQPQGEPVALAIPDECPHIIVFDDSDRSNEYFCGSGARPAALRRYEQISRSWNAHLFVRISRNSRDDRYSCATVADPAEVERLRAVIVMEREGKEKAPLSWQQAGNERDTLRADIETMRRKNNEYWHETEALRAQLAETEADRKRLRDNNVELTMSAGESQSQLADAHALLQEIRGQSGSSWLRGETQHKLDTVLSASAEPEAT